MKFSEFVKNAILEANYYAGDMSDEGDHEMVEVVDERGEEHGHFSVLLYKNGKEEVVANPGNPNAAEKKKIIAVAKAALKEGLITEAKDVFPDVDVIKIDPDRADPYDVVSALMPTLVRMAYVTLSEDQVKYKRTHTDPEDKFEFTEDALEDLLDDLIKNVRNRLDDQSAHDKKAYIDRLKGEFKNKLEEEE
jgi:hypothetical protein